MNGAIAMADEDERIKINIEIASDYYKATAMLELSEPCTNEADQRFVMDALKMKNIVYGIDHEGIRDALASGPGLVKIVVAKGEPHRNATNAYITHLVNFEGHTKPIINEDGSVDFKNLLQESAVKTDTVLAIKTPLVEGADGMTVTGKKIPHKQGKDAVWKIGENVRISDDGNAIISEIDGIAKLIKDRITVSLHIEVDEVGPKTGNIYFGGDIHVKGDVLEGFTVHCDGSLNVDGHIEGSVIRTKGDLTVSKGILGHNDSDIIVEGKLTTKFIENATLYVKGDIETGEIINSHVLCDSKIIVRGKKGMIIGGDITSKSMIEANQIGSRLGVITTINLGVDISAIKELKELRETIQALKIVESRLKTRIPVLKHNALMQPEVGFHEDLYRQYEASLLSTQIELEQKQERLDQLMNAMRRVNQGKVKINSIHPDTMIRIGDSRYFVDKTLSACVISKEGDQVQVVASGDDKGRK